MRLEHNFTVPVPVDAAWGVLLDLPRIAPCMPGATLTGVDDDTFTGTVKVKLGPIALTYQGKGRFVERDEAAHRVIIEASGRDQRSAGTASATVTAVLAGDGDTTKVDVVTDLTVTGKPAQFGRGMIADVGGKLIGQFADCVAAELSTGGEAAPQPKPTPAPAGPGPEPPAAAPEPPAAGTTEPAAGTTEPAAGAAARPAAAARERAEAEPIDLFRLAGSTETGRRLARYGAVAVLLALLAWLATRRRRR